MIDNVRDVLQDCAQQGIIEELRQALGLEPRHDDAAVRVVRDLVYELAGARNRDLAVDVLIYATGVAEFDVTSLRGYAARHGLTPEGFRQQVLAIQRRLGLPPRPMQHCDANWGRTTRRRIAGRWHRSRYPARVAAETRNGNGHLARVGRTRGPARA